MTRDHRRFAQLVRKLVRDYVNEQHEAPGLTLWVSPAGDPRAAHAERIGAASDVADVKFRAVNAIIEAGSHFAAIGRLVRTRDTKAATNIFALLVWARGVAEPAAWAVPIVAGRIEAWLDWAPEAYQLEGFEFVPAALERVAKIESEGTT